MARYRLIVDDAEKYRAFERRSYMAGLLRAGASVERASRYATQQLGEDRRANGHVHTEAEAECPDGLPNCRNCGDPAYGDSCREAGHCPHCGTRHGIAPDAVLAQNGLRRVAAP